MSNEWPRLPLGDVITLQRGFDLPTQDRKPGNVPIVSSSGVSGYHSAIGVAGPGVVTGRYGTIGQVFFIEEDYWPLNTTLWVKDFQGNDPRFVSHLLRTIDFRSCSDKSSVPGVNRNDLHRIPVSVPALREQKEIAKFLGTFDKKIGLNQRMNVTLEEIAKEIFKSWFVRFDPVRAKIDGRRPFGMESRTAALFPGRFSEKDLGRVPAGWKPERWGALATLEYGRSLQNYATGQAEFPVYGTNGLIGWHSKPLCTKPGIIIGRKGAYRGVHLSRTPFYVIDTAFYLSLKTELDLYWAYFELLRFDINGMDSGSAIPSTSREDFYAIPVVVPPLPIMKAFGETASLLYRKIDSNLAESATLVALRDLLLPKLISGEIRLKDAEKELAAI
ncbi:MAG: restriction endonuclease subunit S [Bryobacteraceae bacterium]|jgi:type I restriction enzyme, S subunit